ncbi:MAG: ABC transporter permease [Fimbriimonadaceae bacterium]
MIGTVYKSALRDFIRPGRIVVWVMISLIIGLIAMVWMRLSSKQPPLVVYGQVIEVFVFRVLALVSAIFSTMVISQELDQKTIVYLTTRPIPRPVMIGARMLASMTISAVIAMISVLFAGLFTVGPGILGHAGFWNDLVLMALGASAYGALFVFIGLLLNKAMIYCLLFAFGWETFVPNMPGDLFYVSIYPYLKGLSVNPEPEKVQGFFRVMSGSLQEHTVGKPLSVIILVAIAAAFSLLSLYWFNKHEYVARDEAD